MSDPNKNTLNPSQWLASYGDYLFSYAVLKVGNTAVAEDLLQETFLSGIKARDSFKGESSEKTWLVSILKNKIIDYYRKKDILKDSTEYLADTEQQFSSHFFDNSNGHWLRSTAPVAWNEAADKSINDAEFSSVLRECIQKMPSKLVPIFLAKFIDEQDAEEICKVHRISTSNYWVILHRARVLMRSCLEKNWIEIRVKS